LDLAAHIDSDVWFDLLCLVLIDWFVLCVCVCVCFKGLICCWVLGLKQWINGSVYVRCLQSRKYIQISTRPYYNRNDKNK